MWRTRGLTPSTCGGQVNFFPFSFFSLFVFFLFSFLLSPSPPPFPSSAQTHFFPPFSFFVSFGFPFLHLGASLSLFMFVQKKQGRDLVQHHNSIPEAMFAGVRSRAAGEFNSTLKQKQQFATSLPL
ncbi:unnamed protein product [Cuscuta europaea]|uniref:Transmembrane protein n=1 Tax=Cuscuta europaea TaxID=41803 RepID=A0A9P0YYL8_CUSEU|nr:unnamed protein product [Cuscuta europaea]